MIDNNKITSEAKIEKGLMNQLSSLGYTPRLDIKTISDIENNIRVHLNRLNKEPLKNTILTDDQFDSILKQFKNCDVFGAASLFEDKITIKKTNKESYRLICYDPNNRENNIFEYSHQIKSQSNYVNIGDVTIFMNGFPICHIELKKSGIDISEAYNQILRYKIENFDNNIYKFTRIFIVSNNEYTKYFANNHFNNTKRDHKYYFNWSDNENKSLNNITDFANSFFDQEVLFNLISKYTILTNDKLIMILRPYQYYAVQAIIQKIKDTNTLNYEITDIDERSKKLNGYIYHATGSGKTLTSFKVCEVLASDSSINKIIFLVDRIDLNRQTMDEYKKFSGEDLDETPSSGVLEKQLSDPTNKIIVTTIQKMHRLLNKSDNRFIKNNKQILSANNIFIIDECHRTQFGDMHKDIRKNFIHSRLIGFTGTPIYKEVSKDFQTTPDIFGQELHNYKMVNAIEDGNVLKFRIQYVKGPTTDLKVDEDIETTADRLDTEGFFKSDKYIQKIAYFINNNIKRKNTPELKTMLTTSSIENAIKLYWEFRKSYPDLNVATIFSFLDNDKNIEIDEHSKHKLEEIIEDYNATYNKSFSTNNLRQYYSSIQNNLKNKGDDKFRIQLIIVVNMLTTGFDCKYIDTIYLDRKLITYNLIQTISRTNRIFYDAKKPIANVISLRTFKRDVDFALGIYNEGTLTGYIDKDSLESFIEKLNDCIDKLKSKWKSPDAATHIRSEDEQKEFITIIRTLNKLLSIAKTFLEFDMNMINITHDEIEGYKSVYQNIYEKVKNEIITAEIIKDIDFELETFEDEINVDYILDLVKNVKYDELSFEIELNKIMDKIKEISSKSKKELIESFIQKWKEKMLVGDDSWKNKDIQEAYIEHRIERIIPAIEEYCKNYNLDLDLIKEVYFRYHFEKKTINAYEKEIDNAFIIKPKFLERKQIIKDVESFIIDLDTNIIEMDNPLNSRNRTGA